MTGARPARDVMLAPLSALGTALAALGAVAALGPSLLPRDLVMQCLGCALAARFPGGGDVRSGAGACRSDAGLAFDVSG